MIVKRGSYYVYYLINGRLGLRFFVELIKMVKYMFYWVGSEMGLWIGGIECSY